MAQIADRQRWDSFVSNHSASTPYQLMAWTMAVERAYGFKSFNLIAEENNRISGILAMTMLKTPFQRPVLVALPYCDVGTILATSSEARAELFKKVISIAKSNNVSVIDIRGGINPDLLKNYGYAVQNKSNKVRMLLDLPGSAEELWTGFKSKLRSQVRKAEKNNLTFKWANEKIDDFYLVFSRNMRDLGSPAHSKRWFVEIIRQFAGNAKVGLVHHKDKAIGAGIILGVGHKISIPWASTLRKQNRLSPNMLLYWKFLEYAADGDYQIFDFGRSTPNEGTYKFKAQWGAKPEPLPWHNVVLNGGKSQETQVSRSKNRFLAEKIWQKFPINLANILGPRIRKYISL